MITTLLIVVFVFLNIVDTLITIFSIKKGLVEKNLFLNYVLNKFDLWGFALLKFIIIFIIVMYSGLFAIESLVIINIVYLLIVLNNVVKIFAYKEKNRS